MVQLLNQYGIIVLKLYCAADDNISAGSKSKAFRAIKRSPRKALPFVIWRMVSIENIYQTKLSEFKSVVQQGAGKCGGAAQAFAPLLFAIEQRLGAAGAFNAVSNYAVPQNTQTRQKLATSKSSAEIEAAIESAAQKTGLNPDLLRAVIQVESSFRVNVVSGAGAQGLMQLMPGTAKEMGVSDPFDAYQNVKGGAGYLKKLLKRFGDIRLALAAYNTGQGRIAKLGITDPDDSGQYSKISSGVRGYVDKVLKYYEQFKRN